MEFGDLLRKLRTDAGLGLKRLGPELGVSYGYLSKLENHEVRPSEEFVNKVAKYFSYSSNQLLLSAGRVPPEVVRILRENPDEAIEFLRKRFAPHARSDERS